MHANHAVHSAPHLQCRALHALQGPVPFKQGERLLDEFPHDARRLTSLQVKVAPMQETAEAVPLRQSLDVSLRNLP